MASTPPPPPAAKCPSAVPTTIQDLDDDVLREVFIRLPALPSLVRAALTCHAFLRAVRSSPAFRRRFRDLHPSPFVGLFIQRLIEKWEPGVTSFAAHHRRSDRDFAAAVRGGDFALNGLPDPDDDNEDCGDQDKDSNEAEAEEDSDEEVENNEDEEDSDEEDETEEEEDPSPVWEIERCSDGYVVLFNRMARQIAAYNPLTRALHLFPSPPGIFKSALTFQFHLISSEEHPGSPPRVVCFYCGYLYASVGVISPESTEIKWQIFPEPLIPGAVGATGKMVNGSLYWTHPGRLYITVLDTATLQFSRMELPPLLAVEEGSNRDCDFVLGNTKDGRPCIVSPDPWGGCELLVFFWRPDEYDGVERWKLDQEFKLKTIRRLTEIEDDAYVVVHVMDVTDGIVYMRTAYDGYTEVPQLLLSFCLETAELKKICEYDHKLHPYVMAWPPSLVGVHDKGHPSNDQALSTPSSEGSDVKAGGGPTEPAASVPKA
ncbi:hypothetical protein CFC21_087262 [Triticum aestivum]|uniref:Uncharacterized protein n=2 Tax=Triticum aestivum TaxID=4565 RepID=A0A3B6PK16_WHEAT|nr:uncharacterized protein LOC119323020 [Triticum dicoccoides]XP_044411487.1 uncharacterized protein LOC123136221 [Triticum aestivum]KAF7083479.1 hypothetical protein CFC21_087262 [Triticum aestivum]